MNEENKTPQPVEWVEPAPAKPRKKIRHMIWAVVLIALAMMLAGQLLGDLSMNALAAALHITDGATLFLFMYLSFWGIHLVVLLYTLLCERFLFMYLSFWGIHLVVLLYTLLCERPIFRSFTLRGPNGGSGNTWKLFGLGLLVGFVMNAICILAAYLHGDLDFSVGRFNLPYLLAALGCVCVQSGAEELLCRGYMFGALRERYNVWVAGIVNSLLFGALHLANPGVTVLSVVNIVLFGLALSVAMAKLESLWFCVAVHTLELLPEHFLWSAQLRHRVPGLVPASRGRDGQRALQHRLRR